MTSKISCTCPWADIMGPRWKASVSVTSSVPHSLPLWRWMHQIVHVGPCAQSRWPALRLFEVAAVRKPFSLVMSPHHFPNNRGNKHSLEMAGQMCWSFHKERQLLGRQLSSLWGKKSMKPRIKSDRRYGDETKAVATVTKTWRMQ